MLLDLFSICLQAGGKRIFSRTLVAGLNAMTERPWAELRPGRKVTETWLARQLRNYGIEPKTIWLEGQAAKGYLQEELDPVCRRYLPKEQVVGLLLGLAGTIHSTTDAHSAAKPQPSNESYRGTRGIRRKPGLKKNKTCCLKFAQKKSTFQDSSTDKHGCEPEIRNPKSEIRRVESQTGKNGSIDSGASPRC